MSVKFPSKQFQNSLCSIYNIWLFIYSVPNWYHSAKYTQHLNKVFFVCPPETKPPQFCEVSLLNWLL